MISDLSDEGRRTYQGPASELREVLRAALDRLAPNEEIERADWWRESRRANRDAKPTQAEKTKFILRRRRAGSAAEEAAESYMNNVEERLGQVVRASYTRASAATHAGADRDEVLLQLKYVNALLTELLPAALQEPDR